MAVVYRRYGRNNVLVSRRWYRVLTAADKAKVRFTVTSGHRTIAEQWRLFRQNMRWDGRRWVPRPGRPLTAFPSPTAPHIRTGLAAHAIDVNTLDGGEARLERWIDRQGVDWKNTVRGEAWHGELSTRDLRRLDRKLRRNR
jgi:hypothetical protein